ncbi:MAG: hypothetical protein ACJ8AT_36175 [Hyalangium sp.]|uniref:hypothetical protein n=1 Tax=Hyalangium sp. TaxID=2028555 RepID=UPI00389A517C
MSMRTRQWVAVTALVVGAAAVLGCGQDPATHVNTNYYKGINTTRAPDGQVTGTGETLLRRVFDGVNHQIIEDVMTKDDQQGVQQNTLTFVVSGSRFEDPTTGFTGELHGDPWDWSSWTATGTLPNGLTVESTSTISPNKVIVDMNFKSGDAVQFTVKHEVAAILEENYERIRSQWKPQ